jgi:hypothetical protein
MYNPNYTKLIKRMLPKVARLPKWQEWIFALIKPIRSIDTDFQTLRDEVTHEYGYNGLKHSLEALLNDGWDAIDRGIYIETVDKLPMLFIKDDGEQPDAYLKDDGEIPDYFIWDAVDVNSSIQVNYEFKVMVPAALEFIPEEMLELLDVYRFAGLRPRIFTFGIGVATEINSPYDILGNE